MFVYFSHPLQRSPEDLQQPLAWYDIRGTLLQANYDDQAVKKALELAAVCEHPDAVWLTKLFAGRDVNTGGEARQVFLEVKNDPRALCFAGVLAECWGEIKRAANLGEAYAQACMALCTSGEEPSFSWAEKSAVQGEPDGFYELGCCYRDGVGCEKDKKRAKENFLIAVELGSVLLSNAMIELGELLEECNPQRFVWMGKAAVNGNTSSFLTEMVEPIRKFNSGTGHANVVFAIGRALKGHIDNEKGKIFESAFLFESRINLANQAVHIYNFQLQSYRKAVDTWTLVGIQNNIVRDIRKMIANMIWDAREEAEYELKCSADCDCPFCVARASKAAASNAASRVASRAAASKAAASRAASRAAASKGASKAASKAAASKAAASKAVKMRMRK